MVEDKSQRWYHSRFFSHLGEGLGASAVILAICFGIKSCNGPTLNDVEIERVRHGYVIQERDLNGNGIPEKYINVSGIKYFSEIDEKSLEGTLKK